jgi:hypothetical protein
MQHLVPGRARERAASVSVSISAGAAPPAAAADGRYVRVACAACVRRRVRTASVGAVVWVWGERAAARGLQADEGGVWDRRVWDGAGAEGAAAGGG